MAPLKIERGFQCEPHHPPRPAWTQTRPRGGEPRHDWTLGEAEALFALPFSDLIYARSACIAPGITPNTVQMSTLLSIKTGGCPEDCAYCPQSVRYQTGVDSDALMPLPQVLERARAARPPAPRASAWAPPTARPSARSWKRLR